MKGTYVQTTLYGEDLIKIVETGLIGRDSEPLLSQPPAFKDIPLTYCSYVNGRYTEIYGNREGVMFETDNPIVFACPVDTFELMRAGNWLPGHEQFIFTSLEAMLKKYPTPEHFKKDFQRFFRSLKPKQVYPENSKNFAESNFNTDYCLDFLSPWKLGCNEVTFKKPLKVKKIRIFHSKEELHSMIK